MSTLKTQVKKVRAAIEAEDIALAEEEYRNTARLLDRAGCRRLIHPNAAGRTKSRLQRDILRAKLDGAREGSVAYRSLEEVTRTSCGKLVMPLAYRRYGSSPVGVPGSSKTPIAQIITQDTYNMDVLNQQLPALTGCDVTITAWPSDLTLSIEMRLARRSLSDILQCFQRFRETTNFRKTDEYLLVPKEEENKRENDGDKGPETSKAVTWTSNAMAASVFERFPPKRSDVERHLGSSGEVAAGMLVVEGNAGDIRLYRARAGGYGVFAALWLSDSLADVGEDIIRSLHQHGNDASLRRSCREAINDVVNRSIALLEHELGTSYNAGRSNTQS